MASKGKRRSSPPARPAKAPPPPNTESAAPRPGWGAPWVLPVAIVLLTALAYASAYGRGFVWDDEHHIAANTTLRDAAGLARMWTDVRSLPQFYPLTHTTFWLEYRLWGPHPLGYHVTNVLLHAANAVLVGVALRRLAVPGAWLAAALFAVHPVHVESVAWITERKNVLSGLFYLLAGLAYLTFTGIGTRDRAPAADRPTRGHWGWYAAACALFACALLSKSVTASLPAALGLILWWKRSLTWRHVALLLPMLIAGAAMGRLTAWLEVHHVGARGPAFDFSVADRVLIAGRALWFYLGKLLWPHQLIFTYPRWHIDDDAAWQYLFPLAAVALVATLVALRHRVGRAPLVAALFFGGTLFPALGFADVFPMLFSFVADHFQYLASIGPIALFAAVVTRYCPRAWAAAPAAVLLPVLALQTYTQCFAYDDYETLYRDTIEKNPAAWMAHNNLGTLLEFVGRHDEAIASYTLAAAHVDYDPDAHVNLGKLLTQIGRPAEAVPHLRTAVRIAPADADAHFQLARALEATGDRNAAITAYRQALRLRPGWDQPTARLEALTRPPK
ncbi:MAG TPA: tetratricopeptide repeat protein [Tepidisphaeraceae bacterium]|nr:tetratricopeptide repeat protein [Tepidisphaeraceae bacterium]